METKPTFADRLRIWFKWLLDPIAGFLNRLGLMPNTVTLLGLVGTTIGAVLVARGNLLAGGLIILVSVPIDALDGAMARLRGMPTDFGAFVDSVTDRYGELAIFGGLMYYFAMRGDSLSVLGTFFATAGSVLVSYVKARAESLGFSAKVGILTRVERYLVLAPALIFNQPVLGVWIVAVLANLTALQRILEVRKQAHARQS